MTGKLCVFHGKLNFWVRMALPRTFLASFPSTTVSPFQRLPSSFQFPSSRWERASSHIDFRLQAGWVGHSMPPSSPLCALLFPPEPHVCVRRSESQFLQSTPTPHEQQQITARTGQGWQPFPLTFLMAQMRTKQPSCGSCYSCVLIATLLKIDFMFYWVLVVHTKMEEKVQKFPMSPLPPYMHSLPHQHHLPPKWDIRYHHEPTGHIVTRVHSLCKRSLLVLYILSVFDKCTMTCSHHYTVTQNSFIVPQILFVMLIPPSLPQGPGNHWFCF